MYNEHASSRAESVAIAPRPPDQRSLNDLLRESFLLPLYVRPRNRATLLGTTFFIPSPSPSIWESLEAKIQFRLGRRNFLGGGFSRLSISLPPIRHFCKWPFGTERYRKTSTLPKFSSLKFQNPEIAIQALNSDSEKRNLFKSDDRKVNAIARRKRSGNLI